MTADHPTQDMKVVSLPASSKAAFFSSKKYPELLQIGDNTNDNPYWIGQHLYILNQRTIKAGDKVFHPTYGIGTAWKEKTDTICISYKHDAPGNRANDSVNLYTGFSNQWIIEAATDESLKLLLVPKGFVRRYVDEGGKIDTVKVEMAAYMPFDGVVAFEQSMNPDENTRIIPKSHDNYIAIVGITV
jgi:hypothetical protein